MTTHDFQCPACGSSKSTAESYGREVEFKGLTFHVVGLSREVCSHCGYSFEGDGQHDANVRVIKGEFINTRARVKRENNLLDGASIRAIRVSLGLTQREASVLLGGGANAFSKYENEEIVQSFAMDKLLRMVDWLGVEGVRAFQAGKKIPSNRPTEFATTIRSGAMSSQIVELSTPVGNNIPTLIAHAVTGQKILDTSKYITNPATGALISIDKSTEGVRG